MHNSMIYALDKALGRIQRIQMEMATGKRVLRPSDDPAGTSRILALRRQMDDNAQYQRNIADGLRWNTLAEGSLTTVTDILMQMKDYAVRGANESTETRKEMGVSVDQLFEEILDQSRARIDGRFLFSGFNSFTAPFVAESDVTDETFTAAAVGTAVDLDHARIANGSVVVTDLSGSTTYTEGVDYTIDYDTGRLTLATGSGMVAGTDYLVSYTTEGTSSVEAAEDIEGSIVRQIDRDRRMTVNFLGTDVFQGDVDVFQLGIDLKNALWRDDPEAVRGLLDTIDSAITQITEKLGLAGTRAQNLEHQQLWLESDEVTLHSFISDIESADLAEAVVRLQSEQMAYESALATTARIMQSSLVNYL
jgi:flagellar hook-associated protein 3 FlgL